MLQHHPHSEHPAVERSYAAAGDCHRELAVHLTRALSPLCAGTLDQTTIAATRAIAPPYSVGYFCFLASSLWSIRIGTVTLRTTLQVGDVGSHTTQTQSYLPNSCILVMQHAVFNSLRVCLCVRKRGGETGGKRARKVINGAFPCC